jgi:hypothetical protein
MPYRVWHAGYGFLEQGFCCRVSTLLAKEKIDSVTLSPSKKKFSDFTRRGWFLNVQKIPPPSSP